MATADASDERPRRSLHPFGFAAGLYLALLALPPVFEALGPVGAAAQYVTFLGALAAVTGGVWLAVARSEGMARRLGASRARWLPIVLPVGYVVVGFAILEPSVAGFGYFVVGLAATVVGTAVSMMAKNRYMESVVAGAEAGIELQADWPAVTPRRVRIVWVCEALLVVGSFVAGFLFELDWFHLWPILMLFLQLGHIDSLNKEWTVSVNQVGLVRDSGLLTQVTGWDTVTRYTRTDDSLVLHRPWRPDIRLALDDVAEPDTVEATVARHSPQR